MRNFFEKIRNSEEATRKKWMWILVSFSMILIIGLWAVYINHNIESLGGAKKEIAEESKEQKPSFWEIFQNGLKMLTQEFKKSSQKTKDISIQGANLNFILDGLDEIERQGLPQ